MSDHVTGAPAAFHKLHGPTIAIDGPAASGKSTLGEALARRLGYSYVDSGAVYRAVTWLALKRGAAVADEPVLMSLAQQMRLEVTRPTQDDGRQYTVLVNGEDVTWAIRSAEVDASVSAVSAHPGVRRVVNERLRGLVTPPGTVMVGRDIGTIVLPDADLKVYLTASDEARAHRRCRELAARGIDADYQTILSELRRRDAYDSGRATAPLRPAAEAIHLATDDLTIEQEVEIVLQHLARAGLTPAGQVRHG